jgi:hypothetical protein
MSSDDEWVDLGEWELVRDNRTGDLGVRNARTGEFFSQDDLDNLQEQLTDGATVMGDFFNSREWVVYSPNETGESGDR